MSEVMSGDARPARAGPVRSPQSLIGGLLLIALAALALYLTRDLDQGTLNAMGPAMLPRWLAIGVGLSGLALVVFGFLKEGDALERWSLRGPVFVIGAILAFAVTIRPFSFGRSPRRAWARSSPGPSRSSSAASPPPRRACGISSSWRPDSRPSAWSSSATCSTCRSRSFRRRSPSSSRRLGRRRRSCGRPPRSWPAAAAVFLLRPLRSTRIDVADHSGRI